MWRCELVNLVSLFLFLFLGFFVLGRVLFDEHRGVVSVPHSCTFFWWIQQMRVGYVGVGTVSDTVARHKTSASVLHCREVE